MARFNKARMLPAIILLSILAISCCLIFTLNFEDVNNETVLLNNPNHEHNSTNPNTSPPKLQQDDQELVLANSSTELPIPTKKEEEPQLPLSIDNNNKQSQQIVTTTKDPDIGHTQYIDMNAYNNYNRSSNPIKRIPTSWTELEEQQFCHLDKDNISSDNDDKENKGTDPPQVLFLKYIYNIQFDQDCNSPDTKFIIYPIEHEKEQGLGASLLGNLKRFFIVSMMQKRVFLLTGQYDWTKGHEYCDGFDAMECYFLPISKCNAKDVLQNVANKSDDTQYYEGSAPDDCEFGNNNEDGTLPECKARVIHVKHKPRRYVMNNGDIRRWTKDQFGLGMMAYEAMICQYFLRPRIEIRRIIYDKISKSIHKSLDGIAEPNTIRTKKVLSYPIRASDKCNPEDVLNVTGKHYTHKSEAACFTPEEHVRVMNAINYFMDYQQWTVILTSEDETFLDMVVKLMYDESVSNVTNWRYIRNTEDFSVGEGTTTYKGTLRNFGDTQHLRNGTGTSLETDHIVSALSSLIFQVHLEPEYIVIGDSSTWLKLMWKWLYFMNCNIKPEMHRNNEDDMTQCVELRTPGYLHYYGNFPYKFVKFPRNMWQMMRAQRLGPDEFEAKFGINITQHGWDKWCGAGFAGWMKY